MTKTKINIINGILVLAVIGLLISSRFFNIINFKLAMTYTYGILSLQQLVWSYYYYKNNQKKNIILSLILAILFIIMDIHFFTNF